MSGCCGIDLTSGVPSGGGAPSGPAGGDLGGFYPNPLVTGWQGTPISAAAPADNDVMQFDLGAGEWVPTPVGSLGVTLQHAYDGSAGALPSILVTAANGPVTVQDAVAPIGTIFAIRNNTPEAVFSIAPSLYDFGPASERLFGMTNVATAYGGAAYLPDGKAQTTLTGFAAFTWSSAVSSDIAGGGGIGNDFAPNFVTWAGEAEIRDQGNLFNTQSLFNQASTITAQGASFGPIYTLINQPLLRTGSTGGARTGSQQNAVRSQVRVGPNIAGSFTLVSHEAYFATAIVNATVGATSITTVNYFAPKAPTFVAGGTIGTLNCIDIPNIPAAGITTLRGLNSAMASGTFINHTGVAVSVFAGQVHFNNGVAAVFGSVGANRVRVLRSSAGVLRTLGIGGTNNEGFDVDVDSTANVVEWSSSTGAGFKWSPTGAADAAGSLVLGDALDPDLTSNWWLGWAPGTRTTNLGGDWTDVLFSAGANVIVATAITDLSTVRLSEPGITIGAGSVTNAATLIISNAPTEGSALNFAFWVQSGISRFDGRVDINNGVALGGGLAATLGTIGGAGPTTAAQAQWVEIDVAGVAHWVAAWT